MKFVVSGIKWETDAKPIDGLPEAVLVEIEDREVEDALEGEEPDWHCLVDCILDAASEATGWCIEDCHITHQPQTPAWFEVRGFYAYLDQPAIFWQWERRAES